MRTELWLCGIQNMGGEKGLEHGYRGGRATMRYESLGGASLTLPLEGEIVLRAH